MGIVKYIRDFAAALFKDAPYTDSMLPQEETAEKEYFLEGRYRVKKLIRETNLSRVYLAESSELEEVVIKHYKYEPLLKREVAAFERIIEKGGHESLVSLVEYSLAERLIIMPKAESDLYALIKVSSSASQRKGLDPRVVYKIACEIGGGLQFMHDLSMVHRDLKTANILLFSKESKYGKREQLKLSAKLADFGCCWFDGAGYLEEPGTPVGTLGLMAPEDLQSSTKSPAADIYSFGLVIYEMIAGRGAYDVFFDFETRIKKRFQPLPENEKIPLKIMKVIQTACEIKPENRHQSQLELVEDLRKALY